jgi:hypothetical protein
MAPFEVVNDFAREVLTHAATLIANVLRGCERALLKRSKHDFSGNKAGETAGSRSRAPTCSGLRRFPRGLTTDVVLCSAQDDRFQRSMYPAS